MNRVWEKLYLDYQANGAEPPLLLGYSKYVSNELIRKWRAKGFRDEEVWQNHLAGVKIAVLSQTYGLSQCRIRQIIKRRKEHGRAGYMDNVEL